MRVSPAFLLAALAHTSIAQRAADLNVSVETAAGFQCGDECYANLASFTEIDVEEYIGSDFDWDFYAVADNFTTAAPGDLLKLQAIDPDDLSTLSGIAAYRFQYVSEDLDGTYLPVSGFIALPFSLPESGEFPLVAYAHGTIGTSYGCAPSNGPSLYDYGSWEFLTSRGYAVVATDYAGLGTNATAHKYCAYPAQAKDVFHSVKAARQAFGAVLSKHWMAVGHSQGGASVWRLAEDIVGLAEEHNSDEVDNYLGTVAMGPATRIWEFVKRGASENLVRPDFRRFAIPGYFPLTTIAVQRVYPAFNGSILGDIARARMGLIEEAQLCLETVAGLVADLEPGQLTTMTANGTGPTAADVAILEEYQDRMAPGNGSAVAYGPVLVVQAVNDTAVLAEVVEETWQDACASGSEVHLSLYPKQDHSGVIAAAAPDWLRWVDKRFEAAAAGQGSSTSRGCTKVTKQAFDYETVKADPEVPVSSST
jgi:pimeloyl-ACP methyl ester carboxylesterase